jgi:hypothetical protein
MPTDSPSIAARPTNCRSRVTNGKRLLAGCDGRSRNARRYRDLLADMACDLGGAANLSTAELAILRQAAGLVLRSEQIQADVVNGRPVDADEAVRLANASARLLAALRSKQGQRNKPATMSLRDRLAAEAQAQ